MIETQAPPGGHSQGWKGMLLLVTCIWGLNLPVLKWLTEHFDPVWLAALRMSSGCALLTILLIRSEPATKFKRAHILQLVFASLFTVYCYQIAGTEGIHRTTATNGALVQALQPIIASLAALALLGEALRARVALGAGLGLAGVAVVILMQDSAQVQHATTGDLLILASLLIYSLGAVLAQRVLKELSALHVSVATQGFGAALLLAHTGCTAWWTGSAPRMPTSAWPWVVVVLSGALSTGLSVLMWNKAVAAMGMTKASMWMYWVPIFALASSIVVLREPMTIWHLVGLGLVLLGTRLATQR